MICQWVGVISRSPSLRAMCAPISSSHISEFIKNPLCVNRSACVFSMFPIPFPLLLPRRAEIRSSGEDRLNGSDFRLVFLVREGPPTDFLHCIPPFTRTDFLEAERGVFPRLYHAIFRCCLGPWGLRTFPQPLSPEKGRRFTRFAGAFKISRWKSSARSSMVVAGSQKQTEPDPGGAL
jgi:hypothetical protein